MERTIPWSRLCRKNVWRHLAFIPGEALSGALHDHDFVEMFLFCGEKVIHQINGTEQVLSGGTVVLIRPSDQHCFKGVVAADRKRIVLINLAFPREVIDELQQRLLNGREDFWNMSEALPPQFVLEDRRREQLQGLFQELAADGTERLELERFLLNWFHLCGQPPPSGGDAVMPDWLRQACQAMQEPENLRRGLSRFHQLCGRCPEHCGRELKKYTGQTVTQYVNRLRLQYAARLLNSTSTDIDDIAVAAGFDDLSYFYTRFKEEYRQTPRRYRLSRRAQVV